MPARAIDVERHFRPGGLRLLRQAGGRKGATTASSAAATQNSGGQPGGTGAGRQAG